MSELSRYFESDNGGMWRLDEFGVMEARTSDGQWHASACTVEDLMEEPDPARETDGEGNPLDETPTLMATPVDPRHGGATEVLATVIQMLLADLPKDRPWLNPATEATARSMVRLYGKTTEGNDE